MRALNILFILLKTKRKISMHGEISRRTKVFQIELRLAYEIGRINFVRLTNSHFDIVQNLQVFNIFFSEKLFDMNSRTVGTFRALP